MAILNKSGGDDDGERSTLVSAGGKPANEIDFDPNDPDQVKVHYDLSGWGSEQRAELAETLAELSVPHVWEGDELVVPEEIEEAVDGLFERLETELGPFPVVLGPDEESTEFGLDEWPYADVESLKESLVAAEIPHRWEGRKLVVAQDAEHVVDDLLDAIEAGEVASLDEEGEAPDGALHELYTVADRIDRDPTHSAARASLLDLAPKLSPTAPPFGLAVRAWGTIVERAHALVEHFEDGSEPIEISEAARELRDAARPYV